MFPTKTVVATFMALGDMTGIWIYRQRDSTKVTDAVPIHGEDGPLQTLYKAPPTLLT